jgi:translation initiation factor 2D
MLLIACLSARSKGKAKSKDAEPRLPNLEFMKREELTKQILDKMQSWHEVGDGKDVVRK